MNSSRIRTVAAVVVALLSVSLTSPAVARERQAWRPANPPLSTPWTHEVSPTNALPDYPRPQLTRKRWQNLNGLWEFAGAAPGERPPFGEHLAEQVLVPYPIESALSGLGRHEDRMWYRRTFQVPRDWTGSGQRLLTHFGAVDHDASVWVNGKQVGTHRGGYDKFTFDVTDALSGRGEQELLVGVTDLTGELGQPVGKQSSNAMNNPGGIFYTPASGIWQTVWLEPVATRHINELDMTPDLTAQALKLDVGGASAVGLTVEAVVREGKRVVSRTTGIAGTPMSLPVPRPKLWSPDSPFLYDLDVVLKDRRRTVDEVSSYFGMREIGLTAGADGKQRIALNGTPTFLLGTLDQGYWPDGNYTAPTDAALKFDLQTHKDLGFNAIRKHIKVEPDRWYYWADRLGLLVWQDMPSMGGPGAAPPSPAARAEFERQLAVLLDQHSSTTSIVGWIPFNEGWGEWDKTETGRIARQVKAVDPTRLVTPHSGVNKAGGDRDSGVGDVLDWHASVDEPHPSATAHRAAANGELAGLGLFEEGHVWPKTSRWGYPSHAALTAAYVANQDTFIGISQQCGLSGTNYIQLTDVETEINGLWTYDRKVLKMAPDQVRAANRKVIAEAGKPAPSDTDPGTPGLGGVGSWPADEGTGTTAVDTSGRGHDLALRGDASWTGGTRGSALRFGGQGSAESVGPVVDTSGGYSVSAWVRLDDVPGGMATAVSQDGAEASTFFLQYSPSDRRFAFSTVSGRALASGTQEPGRWYHLVGVRDTARDSYTLYLDGERQSGFTQCSGGKASGPLALGRGKYAGNPTDFFPGAVDEVKVFDRALSDSEVAALAVRE